MAPDLLSLNAEKCHQQLLTVASSLTRNPKTGSLDCLHACRKNRSLGFSPGK